MTDSAPITQEALNRLEANLDRRAEAHRELLEQQIKALQALIDARAAAIALDWKKAQSEYDRRLAELNNAHNLAVTEKERTVSKDMFEVYKESQRKELDAIRSERRESVVQHASLISMRMWAFITAIVVLGLTFTLNYFFRKP